MNISSFNHPGGVASEKITAIILNGTLIVSVILFVFMVYFATVGQVAWLDGRTWIGAVIIAYLLIGKISLYRRLITITNWLLIIFYEALAFFTLLFWGLNAPIGLLIICFAVILPSILMGTKAIFPVTVLSILVLLVVQYIHSTEIFQPHLKALSHPSGVQDVILYSVVFGAFAFVSWASGNQCEKNLLRTQQAEAQLLAQKDVLSIELEKESAALRLAQLNQFRELHKFALLGQSAAATLHELSNHVSVLNLDIVDLDESYHHQQTKALQNAKQSIEHINNTVRQARSQLNSYDHDELFNAIPVINQFIKDLRPKFVQRHVRLVRSSTVTKRKVALRGNPLALKQIISVVLNNALDACCDMPSPKVTVTLKETARMLIISIIDTGVGINDDQLASLFTPVASGKPYGMGVGLYIARHLVQEQFKGTIQLVPTKSGAHFAISLQKEETLLGN